MANMKHLKTVTYLFISLSIGIHLAAFPVHSEVIKTLYQDIQISVLVSGLEHPWGLAFLPGGEILVTERPGRLRIIRERQLDPNPIAGLPMISARGQGGLLDVVLHPKFSENNLVYFSFSGPGNDGVGTEVARGKLVENRLEDVQIIFRMKPKSSSGHHFGSRLVFDPDGYLYITLGDRGDRERAQLTNDHAGSVVRLHDDGQVPLDNPFVGKTNWLPEKYTLGHRNIQGAAIHPKTGTLWIHEHGPQGGDEINIIVPGTNYGWPVITYGVNYVIGTKIGEGTHKPGLAQPIYYWVPSIAPSGMTFYSGEKFPNWRGDLFVGALKDQMLVRLRLDGSSVLNEERLLKNKLGRIRAVAESPDGYLYLLTDEKNGSLVRLEPAQQ
jgi:glucose/arabinose dehydrogenase